VAAGKSAKNRGPLVRVAARHFTYVEPRERRNGVALAKARLTNDLKRLEGLTMNLRVEPSVGATPTTARGRSSTRRESSSSAYRSEEQPLVAALAGQHVARLVLNGRRVVGEERLLLDQHQRRRDVRRGPDGALWVLTDNRDGRLIRIAPRDQ
jgi:Glucose / Sorbosone dehydrogenase